MTNAIQTFNFNDSPIHIVTKDGEPWWVAKDVCEILELSNPRTSIALLDEDEKNTVHIMDGNRGNPETTIVSEAGLYSLILRSRKPEAKAFKRWITHEVLPTIRKTGSYSLAPQLPDFTDPVIAARAWADAEEQKRALAAQIEKDKPNTDFGKALSHAETYVLVSQTATQMKQAGCTFVCVDGDREERRTIGPKYLRKYLENEGYVVKPGRRDSGRPTDKGSKNGRIREKAHIWGPTSNYTSYTPELSPAFVKYLIQRFKASEIRIEKISH